MGSVYARNLAQRVPNARLVAIADHKAELRERFAAELAASKSTPATWTCYRIKDVEAVAIVTSTSTHKEVVMDAAACGKAIFCEKPMSLSLEDAYEMLHAVEKAGVFFHMAFQRRFDAGIPGGQEESGRRRHRNPGGDDSPSPATRSVPRWSFAIRRSAAG